MRGKSDELNELVMKKELADRQVLIQEEEIKHLEETNADTKRKVIQLQEELEKQRKAMKELQQVNTLCCVGFCPGPRCWFITLRTRSCLGQVGEVGAPFHEEDCVREDLRPTAGRVPSDLLAFICSKGKMLRISLAQLVLCCITSWVTLLVTKRVGVSPTPNKCSILSRFQWGVLEFSSDTILLS